jgi:flagellar hook protein FlgE
MQVGLGVSTAAISPVFSQGAIENTRDVTNCAIQGNGFFVVQGTTGTAYTRAGAFSFNSDGKLVTPDGYFVQGYTSLDPTTGAIITTGQTADVTVPPGVLREPTATTSIKTQTNLSASAATGDTFTTSIQIYDSLGTAHVATVTYTKSATARQWTYEVTVPSTDATGTAGTAAGTIRLGTGTIAFDGLGALTTPAADVALTAPTTWTNGATPNAISWDLFDAAGVGSLTGFDSASSTSLITQNGAAPGMIDSVSISPDGTILATFGAGRTVAIGQLALANFNNPKGLVKLGNSRFGESQAAGIPNVGVAGTGGRGTLIGSALEQSNVDIAQEFTQMILAQRGYQANSKTITVSDELLVDTLALKR